MRQLLVLMIATLACSFCFANSQDSSMTKNYSALDGLRTAWQKEQTMHASPQDKNDITIVYGGADISRNPVIAQPTAIA